MRKILFPLLFVALVLAGKVEYRRVSFVKFIGKDAFNCLGLEMMGYNILTSDSNFLYVYDSRGRFPFYAIELKSQRIKGFGAWGSGPGGVMKASPVVMSNDRKYVYAYSPFSLRLLAFNKSNFNLAWERKLSFLSPGGFFLFLGEGKGIYIDLGLESGKKNFGWLLFFEPGKNVVKKKVALEKKGDEFQIFSQNPALKKGPITKDMKGNIYYANYYSSLILSYNSEGKLRFSIFSPRDIPIPKAKIRKQGSIIISDPEKCIQSYISLATDANHLYALFSGEEITMEKILAFKRGEIELNLGEGRIVDVFDKRTGKYEYSLKIPFYITGISVKGELLYATTMDRGIAVFKMR